MPQSHSKSRMSVKIGGGAIAVLVAATLGFTGVDAAQAAGGSADSASSSFEVSKAGLDRSLSDQSDLLSQRTGVLWTDFLGFETQAESVFIMNSEASASESYEADDAEYVGDEEQQASDAAEADAVEENGSQIDLTSIDDSTTSDPLALFYSTLRGGTSFQATIWMSDSDDSDADTVVADDEADHAYSAAADESTAESEVIEAPANDSEAELLEPEIVISEDFASAVGVGSQIELFTYTGDGELVWTVDGETYDVDNEEGIFQITAAASEDSSDPETSDSQAITYLIEPNAIDGVIGTHVIGVTSGAGEAYAALDETEITVEVVKGSLLAPHALVTFDPLPAYWDLEVGGDPVEIGFDYVESYELDDSMVESTAETSSTIDIGTLVDEMEGAGMSVSVSFDQEGIIDVEMGESLEDGFIVTPVSAGYTVVTVTVGGSEFYEDVVVMETVEVKDAEGESAVTSTTSAVDEVSSEIVTLDSSDVISYYTTTVEVGKTGILANSYSTPLLMDVENELVNTNVTVTSADESIATAYYDDDDYELVIEGVSEGTTTITVDSSDAYYSSEIEVVVIAATSFTVVDNDTGVTATQPTGGDNIPIGAEIVVTVVALTSGDDYDTLVNDYLTEDVLGVYEVTLTVNGDEIHDGFGSLTLSFPVDGRETGYVYHLTDDGTVQKSISLPASDDAVTVEVDSLSVFAVSSDAEQVETAANSDDSNSDLSKTGDTAMRVMWGALGVLVALAVVTCGFARGLRRDCMASGNNDGFMGPKGMA